MLDKEKIVNVKFTRRGKGYDTLEVDTFLDEIIEDIDSAYSELQSRQNELDDAQKNVVKAIMTAQTAAQSIEKNAKDEANRIISDSKRQAVRFIDEAKVQESELVERIKKLKEFVETYQDAILRDIDNQRENFSASFLSGAVYDSMNRSYLDEAHEKNDRARLNSSFNMTDTPNIRQPEDVLEPKNVDENTEIIPKIAEQTEAADVPSNKPELETGNMGYIDLDEIISGLPQTDSELKALIDEIM